MKFMRYHYLMFMFITIAVGLLSRKTDIIPSCTGDFLYAVMVYWICRFLYFKRSTLFSLIAAIIFCFSIELLQLVQWPFLISIRRHDVLRLVFGQVFQWSDLMAYLAGSITAMALDRGLVSKKPKKKRRYPTDQQLNKTSFIFFHKK